jgi:cysteine-rich repeat protein
MTRIFLLSALLLSGCTLLTGYLRPISCGDGLVSPQDGEACDNGDDNSNAPNACRVDCSLPQCGDGVTDNFTTTVDLDDDGTPEAVEGCDDGANNSDLLPNACRATCQRPSCGDGVLDTIPTIDTNDDGEPDAIELCDDGNDIDNDSCDSSCAFSCGNGTIDDGEECDDGALNSDTVVNACRTTCLNPSCGDGVPDTGEQCDDGNDETGDACPFNCQAAFCGDGFLGAELANPEECDDGNNTPDDGCEADCTLSCGDGAIDPGEACDDGALNADAPDACRLDCQLPSCGDGIADTILTVDVDGNGIPETAEFCDDGNQSNADDCVEDCKNAICGDGFVKVGSEDCDDANQDNTDGCDTNCDFAVPPGCGDGVTGANEECDDNNTISGDGCSLICRLEFCGDGVTQSALAEACDDGKHCQGGTSCTQDVECTGLGDGLCLARDNDGCDADCALTQVEAITVGVTHSCALLTNGNVRCWGASGSGALGYGSNTGDIGNDETPSALGDQVVNIGGFVTQISAGRSFTCALLNPGAVRCWGVGDNGRLGYGNTLNIGDNESPASEGDVPLLNPADAGVSVVQVATGRDFVCVLLSTGAVRCWGDGSLGKLGYGSTSDIGNDETPAAFYATQPNGGDVNFGGGNAVQVATGQDHTCVLLDAGAVRCWGRGSNGRLGYESISSIGDNETPAAFYAGLATGGDVEIGGTATQIAAGQNHTCALLSDGVVRCWGAAGSGQLGYENGAQLGDDEGEMPTPAVDVGGPVESLTTGASYTCAVLTNGAARCWGRGSDGRLGYANETSLGDNAGEMPTPDVNVGATVIQIAANGPQLSGAPPDDVGAHTCALLSTRRVRCWGEGANGRLGYAATADLGDNETPASSGDIRLFLFQLP